MQPGEAPQVNGTVLRAYVDHVKNLGLEPQVRARLSPAALEKVDKPPLLLSWFDSRLTDEISTALYELRGRDAVREMGRQMTSKSIARLLRPLIATSMNLFGSTPANVFARVETFSSMMVRHADFTWQPASEGSGAMKIEHGVPLHDAAYAVWEGVFLYAFELTGTAAGRVGKARLTGGGRTGVIDLSWPA